MWALKEEKRSRRIEKILVGPSDLLLPHYRVDAKIHQEHPAWKKGHEVGSIDVYISDSEGLFRFDQISNLIQLVRSICLKYYLSYDNVYVLGIVKGFDTKSMIGLLRRK